jgi:hypothetical protein
LQKDLQQRKSPQVRKEQETEIEIFSSFVLQHFSFLRNISVMSAENFLLRKVCGVREFRTGFLNAWDDFF